MRKLVKYSKEMKRKPYLYLQNYPIYGSRLRTVLHAMSSWRPHSIRHLMTKPYHDPLSFYAFWFAVTFGVISILGLIATLAQTYATFEALKVQNQGSAN